MIRDSGASSNIQVTESPGQESEVAVTDVVDVAEVDLNQELVAIQNLIHSSTTFIIINIIIIIIMVLILEVHVS